MSDLRKTRVEFRELRLSRAAAALAFYALFSLGPMLVIILAVAGWVLDEQAVRNLVSREVSGVVGPGAAEAIEGLLEASRRGGSGALASVIAGLVLFWVGSTAFFQLQLALAEVFDTAPRSGRGRQTLVFARLRGFATIVVVGAFLAGLVSVNLVAGWAVETAGRRVHWLLPVGAMVASAASLAGGGLAVAAMYRWLVPVRISWRAALRGASLAAVLLVAVVWLLGWYVGSLGIESGAFAVFPLMLLLASFNYGSQVFLFGAVYAKIVNDRDVLSSTR